MVATIGRYELCGEIASGGTATVHLGRLTASAGFRRVVAIKRLHSELAKDRELHAMLVDEARIAARVRHPNVVPILDVVELGEELLLVMEYVAGESLARVRRTSDPAPAPPAVAARIMGDVLRGLHSAHEATGEGGGALEIVHRDVSPQNVLVGIDGVSRVVDFGIAKAVGRMQTTRDGDVKGKAAYMAPEQLRGESVDRRTDVFAAGVVLWELLTGKRLFAADSPAASMIRVLELDPEPPSEVAAGIPPALDDVVLRALSRDREARFPTAEAMGRALEAALPPAASSGVASWLEGIAGASLSARAEEVRLLEAQDSAPSSAASPPSNALPAPRVVPAERRAPAALIGALLAIAVVGVVVVLVARRGDAGASAPVSASASASRIPTEDAAIAADVPDEPGTDPLPLPVTAPRSGATMRPRAPGPSGRASSKSARCTPPYVVDPNGIHVLKPDCL